jgi:beta-lactamase superfamily II metal-dependent hydrolase
VSHRVDCKHRGQQAQDHGGQHNSASVHMYKAWYTAICVLGSGSVPSALSRDLMRLPKYFAGPLVVFALSVSAAGFAFCAQAAAPPLELVVLGSGGPGATGRAASSYLVLVDGTPRILVDAGSGAFARLGEAKLSLANVDIVLLTHLHIDHAGELPGLFKARAVSSSNPIWPRDRS